MTLRWIASALIDVLSRFRKLLRKQLNDYQLHDQQLVSFANVGRGHGPGMLRGFDSMKNLLEAVQ